MGRQEQRIKELVLNRVARCGQCGVGYDVSDVNVLGHKEDLWFLMLICAQCHQAVGVAAVVKELPAGAGEAAQGSQPEGAIAPQDARETPSQPVTAEDVADVRDFLREFDGDFRRLFGE